MKHYAFLVRMIALLLCVTAVQAQTWITTQRLTSDDILDCINATNCPGIIVEDDDMFDLEHVNIPAEFFSMDRVIKGITGPDVLPTLYFAKSITVQNGVDNSHTVTIRDGIIGSFTEPADNNGPTLQVNTMIGALNFENVQFERLYTGTDCILENDDPILDLNFVGSNTGHDNIPEGIEIDADAMLGVVGLYGCTFEYGVPSGCVPTTLVRQNLANCRVFDLGVTNIGTGEPLVFVNGLFEVSSSSLHLYDCNFTNFSSTGDRTGAIVTSLGQNHGGSGIQQGGARILFDDVFCFNNHGAENLEPSAGIAYFQHIQLGDSNSLLLETRGSSEFIANTGMTAGVFCIEASGKGVLLSNNSSFSGNSCEDNAGASVLYTDNAINVTLDGISLGGNIDTGSTAPVVLKDTDTETIESSCTVISLTADNNFGSEAGVLFLEGLADVFITGLTSARSVFSNNSSPVAGVIHLVNCITTSISENCDFEMNSSTATGESSGSILQEFGNLTVNEVTFTNNYSRGGSVSKANAVYANYGANTTINNCNFENTSVGAPILPEGQFITMRNGEFNIMNSTFELLVSSQMGIRVSIMASDNAVIQNCRFSRGERAILAGVWTRPDVNRGLLIEGCSFYEYSEYPIDFDALTHNVLIANSNFWDSPTAYGVRNIAGLVTLDVQNCNFRPYTGFLGDVTTAGIVRVDPQYVDAGNEDYRLLWNSPLMDAGVNDIDLNGSDVQDFDVTAPDVGWTKNYSEEVLTTWPVDGLAVGHYKVTQSSIFEHHDLAIPAGTVIRVENGVSCTLKPSSSSSSFTIGDFSGPRTAIVGRSSNETWVRASGINLGVDAIPVDASIEGLFLNFGPENLRIKGLNGFNLSLSGTNRHNSGIDNYGGGENLFLL